MARCFSTLRHIALEGSCQFNLITYYKSIRFNNFRH
nr:MAG TPA: hypothetical protein [Caudoviricetes sp.]